MDKRLDITFRFRPLPSTPDGVLLNYIRKQESPSISHDMLLKAARAFWLLEAYQQCGGKKNQELKKLAQSIIFVLEEQANYFRAVFGIERLASYQMMQVQSFSPNAVGTAENSNEDEDSNEEDEAWRFVQRFDSGGL